VECFGYKLWLTILISMAAIQGAAHLKKGAVLLLGAAAGTGSILVYSFENKLKAMADSDRHAHSPDFEWPHQNWYQSYDAKSIRRGYEVYKNVCATCHGCFTVAYRMLRNVALTPEECKAEARRNLITDGPDDTGEMFQRPGRPGDYLPSPYANDEKAAYANNGKVPPNLGVITFARDGYENYLFALLTGYCDPPAGFVLEDGLHFNPYFHGGAIAMPPPLYNEVIMYKDGTPATRSQLAKDVSCFLRWAAEPWHDERKKLGLKWIPVLAVCFISSGYWCRTAFQGAVHGQAFYRPKKF